MSVGACFASVALTLDKEAADVSLVAVVAFGTEASGVAIGDLLERRDDLRLVIGQVPLFDASIHIVGPVIAIRNVFWHFYNLVFRYKLIT